MAETAAESFGALDGAGRFERHVGFGDARLGAGDALLHRRFADQEGAGYLFDRQARDDAQRERDLLGDRQFGMAADEKQAQHVVAIMRTVEPLGQRRFRVVEIGYGLVRRQRLVLAARGGHDRARRCGRPGSSQAVGSRGGPFCGQLLAALSGKRPESFLGNVEIAEITQQGADRLGSRRSQRAVDPGRIGHGRAPARRSGL